MKTKTITLADFTDFNFKIEKQMEKIQEEGNEVGEAYKKYQELKLLIREEFLTEERLHLISELYDLIQATAGAIWILENGVSMNDEHIEKMEEYVETGRINNKARSKNLNI